MSNPSSPLFERDLTVARFEALLLRLDPDRARAGEKYEEIRWKLVKFFQWSSSLEAEHLADETFNRIAEKLASEREEIHDVVAFAWGIAKRIKQESLRRSTKTVPLPDLPGADTFLQTGSATADTEQESVENKNRLKCLRICIRRLSAEERSLLLAYHSPKGRRAEERRQLAQQNGITLLALRVRANRLRFKLEECIKKCLASMAD